MFFDIRKLLTFAGNFLYRYSKKKSYKKHNEKEDEEEKVEIKKTSTPTNVLPVYTEEELRAIQEAEEAEEASKYDDDTDYDEFDEYYDDEY